MALLTFAMKLRYASEEYIIYSLIKVFLFTTNFNLFGAVIVFVTKLQKNIIFSIFQVCDKVPKQECTQVPRQECKKVPKQVNDQVPNTAFFL